MNKIVKRSYYTVMVALLILIAALLLSGCQGNPGIDPDAPEFVFVPEVMPIPMPEGIDWINNVIIAQDLIYFTAQSAGDEDTMLHTNDVFSMELNGSNPQRLPNFTLGTEIPAETEGGNIQIYSISVDNDGNIWLAESGEFFKFDLPEDFDGDDWDRWNLREVISEFTRVRKLDSTGAELQSFDIGYIKDTSDWFYIYAFMLDDDNNIYIAVDSAIYVLDSEGNNLFKLDVGWADRLVKMQDGSIALVDWDSRGRVLAKIDVTARDFGEKIVLPDNAHNVHQGNDEFPFIFHNNNGLYGQEKDAEEAVMLVNWIDSDITLDGLGNISFHRDGRILIVSQSWSGDSPRNEIIALQKTPYSELPERTVLTLATFYLDWSIRDAIVQFNRNSTTHRIQVKDYSEFNTEDDYQAGLTRLSAEIISGNIPDILDVSNLPVNQYAAKGLLIDLYTLIDADPEIDRSDLIESVLRATEVNGGLYRIFPSYSIATMMGNPAVVGSQPGWNMDEFMAVLDANPQADFPLGQGLTRLNYLQVIFMITMDNYIDWNAGTTSFDSTDFMDLLMFANTFPEDFDYNEDYLYESDLIPSGRQIIVPTAFAEFDEFQMYRAMLGGDVVFKGFPNESRNGNSLMPSSGFAITKACKDVDGAWEFVRNFITEEYQKDRYRRWGLPVNKAVFEKMLEEAMIESEYPRIAGWNDFEVELKALTQAEANQIRNFIDSVTVAAGQDDAIWNIVSEGATDFFNGRSSVQDTVRVIQNRASIYVSEQS